MSYSATQHVITADEYLRDRNPADLLDAIETAVRDTLTLGAEDPGEVTIGWLARVGGHDVTSPDGRRWVAWDRGGELPHGADQLSCRGRRLS